MINNSNTRSVAVRTAFFPFVLNFTHIRLYAFVSIFVALDVAIPWALHQVHPLSGSTFLPMFFFALMAGLLLGWRVGLLVGFLSPILSFGISGMPVAGLLPQVIAQNSLLGLTAGLLYGTFRLNIVSSLLAAIIASRQAQVLVIFIFSFNEVNPATAVWQTVQLGWPGIAIQVIILPPIIIALNHWLAKRPSEGKNDRR